ncbi:hypothetical protein D3C80_1994820 [compost metagenome]
MFKDIVSNNKYAKVLRGMGFADPRWGGGVNVQRRYKNPDGYITSAFTGNDLLSINDKTARCVVNRSVPVK